MALVDAGYPMLVFACAVRRRTGLLTLAQQMRARGAQVLLAAPADARPPADARDHRRRTSIDRRGAGFYPLVEAVARARQRDPDQPLHLNKVTSTL